jgi:transposase InsO family protein
VRELTELIAQRGKPGMIVSDNGTELTSNAVLAWCGQIGVDVVEKHHCCARFAAKLQCDCGRPAGKRQVRR